MTTQREIRNVCDVSARVVTLTADTTLTLQAHEGRILWCVGDFTITLPTSVGNGARYTICHGSAAQSLQIDTIGTDAFKGMLMAKGADEANVNWAATTETRILTDGTTDGGELVGDWYEMVDVVTGTWWIRGFTSQSGTEASPFDA